MSEDSEASCMTDCTERHTAAPDNGVAGEGQKGMPKAGTA
jgi:hypothetical protein